MNESAKKRHLLQRFAFGANFEDSKAYAGLSVDQTLDRLLDVSGELQTAEPMHWVFYGTEEDPFPGSFKFGSYWMHEILTSERPLREQMAIFWHDHFAATDTKIESGPIMHDYVRSLRNDPLGRFRDILHRCVTTVAVLKELDVRGMSRKLPNENFAREVLELHTMGIGRYTEEDIQNLALTFQGWGWFDVYYEMETTHRERMRRVAEEGREFHAFAVMPSLAGRKKIRLFHQDLELDGFEALDLLARVIGEARGMGGGRKADSAAEAEEERFHHWSRPIRMRLQKTVGNEPLERYATRRWCAVKGKPSQSFAGL
jgi:hypothetical protein